MQDAIINIKLSDVVWVFSGIAVIIGAIKAVKSINPWSKTKDRLDKHDQLLDRDKKRLDQLEEMNKVICKSLLAIIDHEITGNGIERLKNVKDELQRVLIER